MCAPKSPQWEASGGGHTGPPLQVVKAGRELGFQGLQVYGGGFEQAGKGGVSVIDGSDPHEVSFVGAHRCVRPKVATGGNEWGRTHGSAPTDFVVKNGWS